MGISNTAIHDRPVWVGGSLYVSKFQLGARPPSSILRYTPPDTFELAIAESGTNGLALSADGDLIGASHGIGQLVRFALPSGDRMTLTDGFRGKEYNAPNDLVIGNDGSIYFTDPDYQSPQPPPQPVQGLYRRTLEGEVELVDATLPSPNGVTLSPDGETLYVGSLTGLVRYVVRDDGSVITPAEPFGEGVGDVDGVALDCAGNVYAAIFSESVVRVLSPDGEVMGVIEVGVFGVTNAAFGGPEGRTLFITAGDSNEGDSIYAIELNISGLPY